MARRSSNLSQVFPIGVKETRCPECQSKMRIISFITQVFDMVSNETRRPRGRSSIKFLSTWDYGMMRSEARSSELPGIRQRRWTPRRLCGYPSMMGGTKNPYRRIFLLAFLAKRMDGQYPINRILWVSTFRVMRVIAKAEQLCSESVEKPEIRKLSEESSQISFQTTLISK